VAFEWPTGIIGWQLEILQSIIKRHEMQYVHFHGCALGLVSPDGRPMKKAWTIATTCNELRERLAVARCDGSHQHVAIEGPLTELSGYYPEAMAVAIHEGFKAWWDLRDIEDVREEQKARNHGVTVAVARQTMADHIRSGHVPYRRECPHCLAGLGRSRQHKRQVNPEDSVLSLDLAGPISAGEDGSRYLLVGTYRWSDSMPAAEAVAPERPVEEAADLAVARCRLAPISTWSRVDRDSVCFKGAGSLGPAADTIRFRRTYDSTTGELLDELPVTPDVPTWKLYKRIPGGKRCIRTEFEFEAPVVEDPDSGGEAVASAPDLPGLAERGMHEAEAHVNPLAAEDLEEEFLEQNQEELQADAEEEHLEYEEEPLNPGTKRKFLYLVWTLTSKKGA